ncbi:MAG: M20/M25/M40 family metallo-hydrolase [Bacteroidales bacterium]|nr:M20/M25/M40 family metallo-hydrolase [Bacteroidales bacterium]MBN2821196.1 M20/M25/M40 family metallo-hydrolase [Bacteroidales bacterium]
MKKINCAIVFIFATTFLLSAQDGINSITKEDLQKHLKVIASDDFQGRRTGETGIELAAKYLENEAAKIGLKPLTEDGSFRQTFDLYETRLDDDNTKISIIKDEIKKDYHSFAFLSMTSADTVVRGEVAFVGYGYRNEESGYDDFAGIDIKDKIVLYMSGIPNTETPEGAKSLGLDQEEEGSKLQYILESGARAVLLVASPERQKQMEMDIEDFKSITSGQMNFTDELPSGLPIQFAFISNEIAEKIIAGSSYKKLKEIQNKIETDKKPVSFIIKDLTLNINLSIIHRKFQTCNIIGAVEGSDPKLKNEYLVYGAHYDHDGLDSEGRVMNGADDNGSGTVGLLELAEAFATSIEKPKRSILFIWFTGEERGLLGSNYYVEHPVIPLENTIACLNLDMIGRVRLDSDTIPSMGWGDITVSDGSKVLVITGELSKKLVKINEQYCAQQNLTPDYSDSDFIYASDQYHFYLNNIPVLFYSTGLHSDYHTSRDDEDRINYDVMQRICKTAFATGYNVADRRGQLKVKKKN